MFRFQDARIDAEHDFLISQFELMNEIVSTKRYDRQGRRECIDLFLDYTSSHFKREEMLMQEEGYPNIAQHVLAHAYLQHEFNGLIKTMPEENPNLAADISLFRDLFLFHILTHDEAFGEWLDQRKKSRDGEKCAPPSQGPF